MKTSASTFSVQVDVTNPGQFFACCGLLELTHRFWPGVEGWFDQGNETFSVSCEDASAALDELMNRLRTCEIAGLTNIEKKERDELKKEKRQLQRDGKKLPYPKEARRVELGTKAREGAVIFGAPFSLVLNWWQSVDEQTPKTWAGRQEIHKIARAAQDALAAIADFTQLFNHACVMRLPAEYRSKPGDEKKAVEPFYFDARRFVHSLDTGFSLDVQDAETVAHPAVELLALVGLQRFRPVASEERGALDYFVWSTPLSVSVASAVAAGAAAYPDASLYKSHLRYRDNQRRYKAFSETNPLTEPTK
jgi:CRISPR-associated protein Csb3